MRYASWATLVVFVVASATGLGAARAGDVAGGAKQEPEKTVTVLRDERLWQLGGRQDQGSRVRARIEHPGRRSDRLHPGASHEASLSGEPTIQIKGKDLDPKARARTTYFLG